MKELTKRLSKIQKELKAPKNQKNNFGKYNYRSCEDILEAVKNLLLDDVIIITDEIKQVGDRVYVKATAKFTDGESEIISTAYARESLTKKGMDESQITGSTSSYARKYALNGLLLIDDSKDSDSNDNTPKESVASPVKPKELPILDDKTLEDSLINGFIDELRSYFKTHKLTDVQKDMLTKRAKELKVIQQEKLVNKNT